MNIGVVISEDLGFSGVFGSPMPESGVNFSDGFLSGAVGVLGANEAGKIGGDTGTVDSIGAEDERVPLNPGNGISSVAFGSEVGLGKGLSLPLIGSFFGGSIFSGSDILRPRDGAAGEGSLLIVGENPQSVDTFRDDGGGGSG